MQLKTILNRVLRHSAFVYVTEQLVETQAGATLQVQLRARVNSRPRCSGCGRLGPGYDTLAQRRFEFVPLWGIAVFFLYAPRSPGFDVLLQMLPRFFRILFRPLGITQAAA